MFKLAQEITLKRSPEDAFCGVLRGYLEGKITECREEARKYEQKYGMSFEEFEKKIKDKGFSERLEEKHGVIQVENDYFEWGGAITDLRYFTDKLEKLSK